MRWIIRIIIVLGLVALMAILVLAKVENKALRMERRSIYTIKQFQDAYETDGKDAPECLVSAGGVDYSEDVYIEGMHHFVELYDYETEVALLEKLRSKLKALETVETWQEANMDDIPEWDYLEDHEIKALQRLLKGVDLKAFQLNLIEAQPERQLWELQIGEQAVMQMRTVSVEGTYNLFIEPKGGWQ